MWIIAAEVQVERKIASLAVLRGSFKARAGQRVEALEVYCKDCRRIYEEVEKEPCLEKIDNRHLIGGDQSIRQKRKMPEQPRGRVIVPNEKIRRGGIDAYLTGVSRPR
ncbi:hypothetical protein ACFCYC_01405 [Streptomyces sp. NPDC056402]|uniref:hypothetical protein n=1 Tax=Streptomyces sp. NPDC056402 TaxID=3345810 RepID=UPI0035DB7A44